MEEFIVPIELDDADLDSVAGGVGNVNITALVSQANAVASEAEVTINTNNALAQVVSNFQNG